ncbi:MAG: transposase IS200 [Candidatus Entotheonella factor]|uniref:Transposase IS200 n=1 Tax=Entotheonella factor TaxID=1429438 RepID=W4LM93_ENTF1|nr:IS200/IS605 family transposase [Candidatus Entotheonella palauensis]ETW99223.1 MAG: transposase IS200 [Candidatus Entotheonella factor]
MKKPRYKRNAGAVFSLKYHLVWCPKYRLPVLTDKVRLRLLELVTEKAHELGAEIHASEVMPDHVHLFIEAGPTYSPAKLAHQIKGYTSRMLRQEFQHLRSRMPTLWSRSYFISSVGAVSEATIKRYIEEQETR